MNIPIDITADGCAFTLRSGYSHDVYMKNIGKGGEHYPATSVIVVYEVSNE